ncbi:TetR/AcrR family transcriptional regulator [Aeromicrobium wangtongii]|uniref:TetR/AcrR family transcriptional regulator n=1 Tax=Aeromicrobium wangtongii TaxID=2969247 RepID=A0ABY5M7B9_9ACTN|nr:TetR/AcrR family transcriptional regulator [Aeromicrobium wangtongii]MCD9199714.1 TetR/AcrR family transcriptional regulator [Aeromicrobium wangtongii]UUP14063.1 TetR/AcrR family transcriptional regulator [Aeromicrobium wangtongii]
MPRPNAGTKGVPRIAREAQILDIASEHFGTHGFAATSLAAIADAAGISKPLIYNYFGSKDGLYQACLERSGTLVAAEIERIAGGDAVGVERGLQTLGGMFSLLEDRRHLWRLFFDTTAPSSGPIAESAAMHADRIGRVAAEGVGELMGLAGNDDPLDASAMTSVWLGIVDSLVSWWVDHPDQSAEQMTQRCRRLVTALFSAP